MPTYDLAYDPLNAGGRFAWLDAAAVATPHPTPPNDAARWAALSPTAWNATEGYPINTQVTNGGNLFQAIAAAPAITAGTITYTEIGRWNDTPSDYRTANDADYTNFGGVSWCANRAPLNNVADPFPLNAATTYRLRYVPGGSATQAAAEVVGTPTQSHFDASPGGGIWCGRFGTAADMTAAFGNPESNPNSPARFNGGTWILERQNAPTTAATADWRATPIAASGTARYNHTGGHLAVSTTTNSGAFPTNLTGTWRIRQVGGASLDGALTIVNPASGGVMDIRVGSQAAFTAAFGSVAITSGGNFELIKVANAAPADDAARWSQLVTTAWDANAGYNLNAIVTQGSPTAYFRATTNIPAVVVDNEYRLQYQLPPANATPPNAAWAVAAAPVAWDNMSAYPQNTLVTNGGKTFRALNAITAGTPEVPGMTSFVLQGTLPNSSQGARYNEFSLAHYISINSVPSWILNGNGALWRVTLSGAPGGNGTITGTQSRIQTGAYRYGTNAEMDAVFFGATLGNATSGTWTFERQITTPTTPAVTNTAPADDAANWVEVMPAAFNGRTAYPQNAIVTQGTITPNTSPPNASWAAASAPTVWNNLSAYPQNALVTNGGTTFRAINAISVASGTLTRASGSDFSLSTGVDYEGAVAVGNNIWIVSEPGNVALAYQYTGTTFNRVSANDVTLPTINTEHAWQGGFSFGNNVWFLETGADYARGYTHNNGVLTRAAGNDLSLGTGQWWGAATIGDTVWIVENINDNAIAYTHSNGTLTRASNRDVSLGSATWEGAVAVGDRIWFIDEVGSHARGYTHNNGTLTRAAGIDVSLPVNFVSQSNHSAFFGGFSIGNTAWFLDNGPLNEGFKAYTLGVNSAPAADTTNWAATTPTAWSGTAAYPQNAIVTVGTAYYRALNAIAAPTNYYRALNAIGAPGNTPPAQAPAWTALTTTAWSATAAYPQNSYVTNGGSLFRARQQVAAPSFTYSAVSTWNVGSSNTTGGADYYQGSGDSGTYATAWFVNNSPATGNNNWVALPSPPTGTYRLRADGGTLDGDEAIGALTITQPDHAGRRAIRIGTAANMRTAFGNSNVGGGGGTIHLESQNAAFNPAPQMDTTNWELITPTTWDAQSAYPANSIVASGGTNYTNAAAIDSPGSLAWTRRNALTAGDRTFAYDTDTAAIIWRQV